MPSARADDQRRDLRIQFVVFSLRAGERDVAPTAATLGGVVNSPVFCWPFSQVILGFRDRLATIERYA